MAVTTFANRAVFVGDGATTPSDAQYRLFIQWIEGGLTGSGLVVTSDTGQIDPTTVTLPGAQNTDSGYRMYRFNDGLQSTAPIFIKATYGRGGGNVGGTNVFRVTYLIGTGSNGAGTVTGFQLSAQTIYYGNNTSVAYSSVGVSDPDDGSCSVVYPWSSPNFFAFSIERSRSQSTLAPTGEGLFVMIRGLTSAGAVVEREVAMDFLTGTTNYWGSTSVFSGWKNSITNSPDYPYILGGLFTHPTTGQPLAVEQWSGFNGSISPLVTKVLFPRLNQDAIYNIQGRDSKTRKYMQITSTSIGVRVG